MQKVALSKELGATTYPGRGIVIGRSKDGKKAVTAYFIMGILGVFAKGETNAEGSTQ